MSAATALCSQCNAALPALARFCAQCGARVANDAPAAPAGERRQVAVLFADLSGYTRLSSTIDAEEVHGVLTRYFELVDGAIESLGGSIDKHVGDAVMGVFGAPVAHGNDVERALRAAVAIHAGMAALSTAVGQTLTAHVGIASGEVVAAPTGSDAHRAYTVTGDAVNLAARLTDLAAAGETVLSDDVRRDVAGVAEVDAVGDIAIRGLPENCRVWKLRGLRTPGVTRSPLVGRDGERRRFAALLGEMAATGTGAVALVCADPGMGKTRLAEAFLAAALADGALCHAATVLDFGTGQGKDAINALAASLLDVPQDAGALERREALARAIAMQRASAAGEPFLADLLAIGQDAGSVYEAMDNESRQQGKLQALCDVVTRAAARAPCVLLVEDVQWASPWVHECLRAIASCALSQPVLLLMTTRREGDPIGATWPAERLARFDLAPLAQDDALLLARIHFASSPQLARRCVDRAQGNPLFLVQLLRSGTDDEAVPASIQSVVLARLDRLAARDKQALQAAAVIGQQFDLALLRTLVGMADYDPASLIERDLVRPVGDRFMFTHALIRDGAYASLLHSSRRALHVDAARWYASRDATLRALHLDRGDDTGAAAAYLEAAAAEHVALRIDASLGLLERATQLAAPSSVQFRIAMLEGELQRELGRAAPSIAAFERARDAASDDSERADALIGIAAGHRLTSDVTAGLAALAAAEPLVAGLPRAAARIAYLRGNFHFAQGAVDACRIEHETALALARSAGDRECEAQAQSGLADAMYAQGRMLSARAAFRTCVDICDEQGFARFAIVNRCMVAIIDSFCCDYAAAQEGFARARTLAAALHHRVAEVMALESAVLAEITAGRFDAARTLLPQALSLTREVGARRFETILAYCMARMLWRDGAFEEARRYAQQAWRISAEVGPRYAGPIALAAVAITAASDDERRRALADGERLLGEGCVAHCHIGFYCDAIDLALAAQDWPEAERYATALSAFMRPEPLRFCDFFVARGMALAAAGRGHPDRAALEALRRDAAAFRLDASLLALDAALASAAPAR